MEHTLYDDRDRAAGAPRPTQSLFSPYCDFILYPSRRDPALTLSMRVLKPARPSYIRAGTHGWHMSARPFEALHAPRPGQEYVDIQVDMRGRAFSGGSPDCNAFELFDVIDAVDYVRAHYKDYILDPAVVYFEGGSGGGGNAYALAGKFPDFFAAINALYGITDYAAWYEGDASGEFRDEMEPWIGCTPAQDAMAYAARSGITTVENLCTPLCMLHGETDVRVPVRHARMYYERAAALGKGPLLRYEELAGVGDRDHMGKASPVQRQRTAALCAENLSAHRAPVHIPRRGEMVVAGYLCTKAFTVLLDAPGKVARLRYDLDTRRFDLDCPAGCGYSLEIHST